MKRHLLFLLIFAISLAGWSRKVRLRWIHTSDIHSSLFAFDYLKNKPTPGGLSSIYAYADSIRQQWGSRLILTDGGDVLQGQPLAYYYNYIDTISPHLVGQAMNEMGYVAGAMGNHDIEAGHAVYDRMRKELKFPLVGANIINKTSNRPYIAPYTIIERESVRIAILGMLTPAIPHWLPRNLWSGLRFDPILESARYWVNEIQQREHPDMIVGIFHSGFEGGIQTSTYMENATRQVAEQVSGIDVIFYGHDHVPRVERIQRADGSQCLTLGPTNAGRKAVELDITLDIKQGKRKALKMEPRIVDAEMGQSATAQRFEEKFAKQRKAVETWISEPIGRFTQSIRERDALFGPNSFVDLIHRMQLDLTGADISLAAPLSLDNEVDSGIVRVRDMFSLYRYENMLTVVRLSGSELRALLEYNYGMWANQMQSPDDHLLLFDKQSDLTRRRGLKQVYYCMDSAAGIDYIVDVRRPAGQRVTIQGMSDGRPFQDDATYRVVTNSYRAIGGGSLLTDGAGIPHDELEERILFTSEKDLRYYIMQRIRELGTIEPRALNNWRFVPEEWTIPAARRDSILLFGN